MTKDEILSLEQIVYKNGRNNTVQVITALAEHFPGEAVLSTSFSMEDQVITHMVAANQLAVDIFTLDTGRLFPETYAVWSSTLERYGVKVNAYYPEADRLQKFIAEQGPNSFFAAVENRKTCCHIRKVEPLQRALKGRKLWITGIRAEHSQNRQDMTGLEWDEQNKLLKYHPLLYWTTDDVRAYIRTHKVPYNPLHDKGFVSIGCAPCTRAIQPGEDFRAGRWWWEEEGKKECGLHLHQ